MEIIILTIFIAVAIIVVSEIIIYFILKRKFQAIDTISDSAIKLDATVSSIEHLNATLFGQVDDLRKLGIELKLNFLDLLCQ